MSRVLWGKYKMKILLERNGENMVIYKDYSDIDSKSEISHMIVELELIKLDLLEMWEEVKLHGQEE